MTGRYEEAKTVLRKTTALARRVLPPEDFSMLRLRCHQARALYLPSNGPSASPENKVQGLAILREVEPTSRRVFGPTNQLTLWIQDLLGEAKKEVCISEFVADKPVGWCGVVPVPKELP